MSNGIAESSSQDSQGSQQGKTGATSGESVGVQNASRSKLVQRLLAASANLPQFVNDLVTTQAVVVAGTEAAGFIVETRDGTMTLRAIAHIRPDNSNAETRAAAITAFQELLRPCLVQGKEAAIQIEQADGQNEPQFCLVTPLRSDDQIVAASAVITRCRNHERALQRLVSMQLVAGYFELFSLRRTSEQSQIVAQSHQHVLQLATAVATAQGFAQAAVNLCNELATRTGASRVALGWLKRNNIRVRAISHTEEFDKKQELILTLEKVMEECVDQDEPVLFDNEGNSSQNVTRSAEVLSRAEGGNIVLSLPLRHQAETVGVVTLEFPPKHKLSQQTATGLSVAVDLLAPQLYDRFQNDRWLITKVGLSIQNVARMTIGPRYMLAKLIIAASIAIIVVLTTVHIEYRVSSPFEFDEIHKATLDAPYDGQIEAVRVIPGQKVSKDQELMVLKTDELQIKLSNAIAQVAEYKKEAQKDLAEDPAKPADAAIALDQAAAAQADADEAKYQISQASIHAPAGGTILKGDWEHKQYATVKKGDELFEIGDTSDLRAVLNVNERDIQRLAVGQTVWLATATLPSDKYKFKIDRIVPLGEAKEGDNVFRVYASADGVTIPDSWKPGLAGQAKVDIDQRTIAWVWTHKLVEYLRLKFWSWF